MSGAHTKLQVRTNAFAEGAVGTVSDNKSKHMVKDIFILWNVSKTAIVKVGKLSEYGAAWEQHLPQVSLPEHSLCVIPLDVADERLHEGVREASRAD